MTYQGKVGPKQHWLAVKAHVQARDKRRHDQRRDAHIVQTNPEIRPLHRMAQQRMVRRRDTKAGRHCCQVDMEDEPVGHGSAGVIGLKVRREHRIADDGRKARHEMRVDVACLIVQIEPALEAGQGGGKHGPVAGDDVWVFAVPFGDEVDGEQLECP